MKLLLDNKADSEARDDDLQAPLIISVKNNDIDMVTLLLCNKADAGVSDRNHQTSITIAIQNSNVAMVKLLLDNKADIEAKDFDGQTPLIIAIQNSDVAMAKLLLGRSSVRLLQSLLGLIRHGHTLKKKILTRSDDVEIRTALTLRRKKTSYSPQFTVHSKVAALA